MGALWRTFEALARGKAAHPALICGERVISYGALRAMADAFSGDLARRGVGPGARCLFWSANSPELAAAILAAWRLGAIIVLVNDEAPTTHFAHAASLTRPAVALVEPQRHESARDAIDAVIVPLLCPQETGSGSIGAARVHDHEPASILFTSGSTGLPKGVAQSHANLLAGCRMVAEHLGLAQEDRIICPIPWSFDYGYGQLLSTLLLGVTQILPEARNPFSFCDAVTRHRPTILASLPSFLAMLIRGVSPIRETDVSSLRLVTNTGGKIAPALFEDMLALFGHCDISLNYGMTETYRSAGLPVDLARQHPESVGFAYPGVSLNVLREDGTEAAPGETGEIVHRGPGVFLGYWGNPEASAKVRRPDPLWPLDGIAPPMAVFSGDLGWKDEQGLLYIKGRRDRLIKSMGVRVSPDEIEAIIRRSGLVRDVAVVGVPHELMGEMVVAAITVPDQAEDVIRALKVFARDTMSNFMQPREYRIVDQFPLTPNGKTSLPGVRTLFEKRPA
jgi:acyl-coenzyme A synthetase/AMP-(fatty) acid ligase